MRKEDINLKIKVNILLKEEIWPRNAEVTKATVDITLQNINYQFKVKICM